MSDSIVFLGTGGDPIVVGKQMRASGGIVLSLEGNQFHLDPGPGSLVRAKQLKVNPRETITVFCSHGHVNHAGDAEAVISAMTYNGMDKHGLLVAPESVVGGGPVTEFFKGCVERYVAFKDDSKVGINEVDIEGTPTRHHDTDAVGFRFRSPHCIISYTGDTEYFSGLVDAHRGSDVLIINCKDPEGMSSEGHMNAEDAAKLIEKTEPELAILTHFGVKFLKQDPIRIARRIQRDTDSEVLAAKDGMVVNPRTFASKVRQKRLDSFDS